MLKRGFRVKEVNPQISKRVREIFTEQHEDRTDAELLAKTLLIHKNLPLLRTNEEKASLKKLAKIRRNIVLLKTKYTNQLHIALTEGYGSLYKQIFSDISSKKALSFFEKYPTIDEALNHYHKVKEEIGEKKMALLKKAGKWELTKYLAVLNLETKSYIKTIKTLKEELEEIDKAIKEIAKEDPDVKLLRTMPGMGDYLSCQIVGEIGEIEKFKNSDKLAAYSGLAPVRWQSGKGKERGRCRKRYSRRLKNAFCLLAFTQLRINPESKAYYYRKRNQGKTHWQAIICLARQLSRIIYAMLKKKQTYLKKQSQGELETFKKN